MNRVNGQITARLVAEFPPTDPGWSPCRSLRPPARPAAAGYRVTARRRSGRRTWWADFICGLVNITAPSIFLWLLVLVTQAESLLYISHALVVIP